MPGIWLAGLLTSAAAQLRSDFDQVWDLVSKLVII